MQGQQYQVQYFAPSNTTQSFLKLEIDIWNEGQMTQIFFFI